METNINDALGITTPNSEGTSSEQKQSNSKSNVYSSSLRNAATLFDVIFWIAIVATVITSVVYMANVGDTNSYSDSKRIDAMQIIAVAAAWFKGSLTTVFSTFVLSRLFRGISVIAEAAEKYLSKDALHS